LILLSLTIPAKKLTDRAFCYGWND